jgi:hypothetical protein
MLSAFQTGRGIPFQEPVREVPTGGDIISPYLTIPTVANNGQNQFQRKTIQVVNVALDNTFTDILFNYSGSFIVFSGQFGGTMAPMLVRLDNFQNDPMTFIFDRALSGIPFKQFWLTNITAQPGVSVEITIMSDEPDDRIGING